MAAVVTADDRREHAVLSGGRFPIFNKSTASSAIRLRSHAKTPAERRKVIRAAAKFLPEMARRAWEADKNEGLI